MEQQAYWMTGKINLDKVERKYLFKGKQGDFIESRTASGRGKVWKRTYNNTRYTYEIAEGRAPRPDPREHKHT